MEQAAKELGKRIAELRRRHFGSRGKAQMAARLSIPLDEYERYERGSVPPGEIMVRVCETTGEDLQWLLTGVGSRGTMVISGTRGRHQDLLARVADVLNGQPALAGPIEAFVDLLCRGRDLGDDSRRLPPAPDPRGLIPIFAASATPRSLSGIERGELALAISAASTAEIVARSEVTLYEPALSYQLGTDRRVTTISMAGDDGQQHEFLDNSELARCFPGIFGVRVPDETMAPMFAATDIVLVAAGSEPRIGHPAVCRLADEADVRLRVWLGGDATEVILGRVGDHADERLPRTDLAWSLEVLYRLAPAA